MTDENRRIWVPEPGLYENLDSADYHAAPAASNSDLTHIDRSPAHYREYKENPPQSTKPQALGTAFHTAILEPDEFEKRHAVELRQADHPDALVTVPQIKAHLKDLGEPVGGKKEELIDRVMTADPDVKVLDILLADHAEKNRDKAMLSRDVYDRVMHMRDAVHRHPAASYLLSKGRAETSIFWHDEATAKVNMETGEVMEEGLLCKCRPDWLRADNLVVDLKKTVDASKEAFQRHAFSFRYYVQSGHYWNGVEAVTGKPVDGFIFIAVEDEPPYAVAVYQADPRMVSAGMQVARANLQRLARCLETDKWPAYPDTIREIDLPPWADRRIVEAINQSGEME